jgi:formylmethanofuran dehydrogenase subunit E
LIRSHTYEEYVAMVERFHGYAAPGVIIGGFMVDLAYRNLPAEGLFDALCETPKCLPDAVQLLTPCTVGNGWLTIANVGRFALTLYDKRTGLGVRVFVDPPLLENWPEIKAWFLKLTPKGRQDEKRLQEEIGKAGDSIMTVAPVKVAKRVLDKSRRGGFAICPRCGEAYPSADGSICLACADDDLFVSMDKGLKKIVE